MEAYHEIPERAKRPRGLGPAAGGIILSLLASMASVAAPAQDPGADFWNRPAAEAVEKGKADSLHVLIFFPPTTGEQDPLKVLDASIPARLRDLAIGGRAGSSEVRDLLARYEVRRLPAVVHLDPHGNFIQRWESPWPPRELVHEVRAADQRMKQHLEVLDVLIRKAEEELEAEAYDRAEALCLDAIKLSAEGYPQRRRAAEIRRRMRERVHALLLEKLALEGLIPDRELEGELARLALRHPLEDFKERIERERERLNQRRIGGK